MVSFLYTVAASLYDRHKSALHRLAVVFPNRRQAVFFKNHFAQIVVPPAFVPQLLTIEELVQQSSDFPVAETLVQSLELYNAYKKVWLEQGEDEIALQDFEQFYGIGEMLLKDFAEIDSFLLKIDDVCKVLHDIEAIEKSFEQLSDEQKEFLQRFWASITHKGKTQDVFLKLWNRLPAIYRHFHAALGQQGFTTLGMAYRQLAEQSSANKQHSFSKNWDHIAFVGFNAFNKAEAAILYHWQQQSFASLWFDEDVYYMNDNKQEAGFFLRRNLHQSGLKNSLPFLDVISHKKMPVSVTAVQGHVAQAKMISQWLKQLPATALPGSIAVLLADESLLLPALQSLPEDMKPVNVTMGYPMQQSVLYSFFVLYTNIQNDLAKNHFRTLHFDYVQQWMSHPLCDWDEEARDKLNDEMQKKALMQVPLKKLQGKSKVGDLIFLPMHNPMDVFARLRQLLQLFHQKNNTKEDALLAGLITALWETLQSAEALFAQLKPAPTLSFILQVLRRQLSGLTVPFEGEPLQGIQIMGLLESRGLDFEHILLLGAAEGTLPRVSAPKTFLPDGVRRAFGLPVLEYQDSIFAYIFYRLLHRCESMQLVYNALVTDNSTGEPSRFIKQLDFETDMKVSYQQLSSSVQPSVAASITVEKSPGILGLLKRYSEGTFSFSPSQINSYLSCRLQYFFKNVAGLKPSEELTEEVDPALFGSIVHDLMEHLYNAVKEHQGTLQITKESIEWMRKQIPFHVETSFTEVIKGKENSTPIVLNGLQQVIKEVVIQYAEAFLKIDETYTPFTLVDTEVQMIEMFPVSINGSTVDLKFKGVIDRVDEKNGVYRMVDYKTGNDKHEFTSVEGLFEREGRQQNKAALQTLIYSWMFQQKYPELKNFEPALLPLRAMALNGDDARLVIKKGAAVSAENINEILQEVEESLRLLLEEIFDASVPFDQTEDLAVCGYCDYKGICRR